MAANRDGCAGKVSVTSSFSAVRHEDAVSCRVEVLDTYADSTDGAGCRVSGTLDAFKGWTRLTRLVLLREMVL